MIESGLLLADLKKELRKLENDLRARAEDVEGGWAQKLRSEYDRAARRERTGLSWIDWRNGEVSQAAVAWVIATVFIRFAEDNGMLVGAELDGRPVSLPWIAGPGDGLARAVENETAFYSAAPTSTSRDWLQHAFRTLAALPAGRPLVDPDHSAVWHAPISAGAADGVLAFFRRTKADGSLMHDFTDPEYDTRFLGDLYQELSEYAKKTFALLQTPVFVEEFILDLTLTPAIAEFGLPALKLIDPTCGSGHFLLGAFDRLTKAWEAAAPGTDRGDRVQRALDSIHGVDLNPFAVAIARFRLTVAAIKAAGIASLVAAPAFDYHLAIGDSLLGGVDYQTTLDLGDGEDFEYSVEDLTQHRDILTRDQYHVVVGNPPYITVKDAVLNQRYRSLYPTCSGKYALSVPFMELFFRLAKKGEAGGGAGYVGQITSNSFMKREFGKKMIEQFLSGADPATRVDLTHVIDTSGAYIPGHGTPTVILIGRRQKPVSSDLRAVLGVRGEPKQPSEPSKGVVWNEITGHLSDTSFDGNYVTVRDSPREAFAAHPWSLSGGGSGDLKSEIEAASTRVLSMLASEIGIVAVLGEEEAYELPRHSSEPSMQLVVGEDVRDFGLRSSARFWPYDGALGVSPDGRKSRWMWPFRRLVSGYLMFGKTREQRGLEWFEYGMLAKSKLRTPLSIPLAFVATHNHFVLDRGGKVFKQSAPVIKLPEGASEDEHFDLLGVLNSSTACFWLKQVSHNKGSTMDSRGARQTLAPWEDFYEFTGTKLQSFPLPSNLPREIARRLDEQSRILAAASPGAILASGTARRPELAVAQVQWDDARRSMIALQEELDWHVYVAYGLADASLAPDQPELVPIEPNERPFEVRLARAIESGAEESAWFERHSRARLTEVPNGGSDTWRELWQARYDAATSGFIAMLERPEFKRRWAGASWDSLVAAAVVDALRDRLEAPELWRDAQDRPLVRSAAQVADDLRRDERFRELLTIHLGVQDFDFSVEVGKLLAPEAVPGLATLRYKPSGLEKFRAWEKTWELQRAEDRGEKVTVPVPPKYGPGDFAKTTYWSARGKLDVPKERFISFPGSRYPDDATELYGWAGWDHGERGLAIARLANDLVRGGAPNEQVIPVLGVLLEIEPWLRQWHDGIDPKAGVSPVAAVAEVTTALLGRLGVGRDGVESWRPTVVARGRKSASS
jgi:hypothetical protein